MCCSLPHIFACLVLKSLIEYAHNARCWNRSCDHEQSNISPSAYKQFKCFNDVIGMIDDRTVFSTHFRLSCRLIYPYMFNSNTLSKTTDAFAAILLSRRFLCCTKIFEQTISSLPSFIVSGSSQLPGANDSKWCNGFTMLESLPQFKFVKREGLQRCAVKLQITWYLVWHCAYGVVMHVTVGHTLLID